MIPFTPQPWMESAACRDTDWPEAWFPPGDDTRLSPSNKAWDHARSVCRTCPVQLVCAEYAINAREPHGMFGGLAPIERIQIRRAS